MDVQQRPATTVTEATGYAHEAYADSLSEFGEPFPLHFCGGWLLKRKIYESNYYDLTGCYPLFACLDPSRLDKDLEQVGNDAVSVSLVTDPFGGFDERYLKDCFPDVVVPFKEHFVVDLGRPARLFVTPHHAYEARKALREVSILEELNPSSFLSEWVDLYASLIKRHDIKGIRSFSAGSFAKQLTVPGMVMFRAVRDRETVGVLLWYVQGDVAYCHLGASNDVGYKARASFALYAHAIERFADAGFRWLDLGAGAGLSGDGTDGLSRFKRGWSTGTRTAYFCGRITDQAKYLRLTGAKVPVVESGYFPAYRQGEFS